jgi:hypothetical protein
MGRIVLPDQSGMNGQSGFGGELDARVIRAPKLAKVREIHLPFGRVAFTRDKGSGRLPLGGRATMMSNLTANHFDGEGRFVGQYNLGSGTVTNVGVNCLINDLLDWTIGPILDEFVNHGCGTGTTASAASDFWLQTAIASGSLTGSTNGYFTGTSILVAPNIYRTVATTVFNATLAVTEWVLTMSNAANLFLSTTGTAANSATYASGLTTGGTGLMGFIIQGNSTPPLNTPTSTVVPTPITTNSATVATLGVTTAGGWTTLANPTPSGTGPGAVATSIVPATLDHNVFAAINVNAADSIQWTYSLTYTSGG